MGERGVRDDAYFPTSTPAVVILDKLVELEALHEAAGDVEDRQMLASAARVARHALYRAPFVRRTDEGALYFADGYDASYVPPPGYYGDTES